MRVNHPVNNTEFPFPDGQTLVSTTDLQGRILYCNPAFVSVSGFAREELLGQPHNLIRHPDMPEEAFRDMWGTIGIGRPWNGMVKNRRKDGSFYWVRANVTPLMDGERPMGYMSVRTKPSRAECDTAETLYRTMRAEAASGRRHHVLDHGDVVIAGRLALLRRLMRPGPALYLWFLFMLTTAIGAIAAALVGSVGVIGAALGAMLLASGLMRFCFGLFSAPLYDILRKVNRMAAGDLTQVFESRGMGMADRISVAMNQLNVNLQSIVGDARREVVEMREATHEIAAGNSDLSSRTESQASSLEQTASSMEEITGTVRQSSDNAQLAAQRASEASQMTQRSNAAVDEVTRTMEGIAEASRRIGEIIQVIDGIAFQTNILALNAAVEAARAGEQGRGFAVVAAEVRALSQRTAGAAREVKQLIVESTERVEAGNRLSLVAAQTMTEAVQSVQAVDTLIGEISAGAREQLTGISQINAAVSQMDAITQQNAALVEQIAASAMSLGSRADNVAESVSVFRLGGQVTTPDAVSLRKKMKAGRAAAAH